MSTGKKYYNVVKYIQIETCVIPAPQLSSRTSVRDPSHSYGNGERDSSFVVGMTISLWMTVYD